VGLLKKFPPSHRAEPGPKDKLDSWKEIAEYLGRSARTVQRWEAEAGLPVHRLQLDKRGSVYALKDEIDLWWESRRDELAETPEEAQAVSNLHRQTSRKAASSRRWLWASLAAVCFVLGVAVSLLWLRQPAPELRSTQFTLEPPPEVQFTYLFSSTAVSPDGRYLVFSAGSDIISPPLWLRQLDSLGDRALLGTEGAFFPFWSPDSASIAFFADGQLKLADLAGGAPVVLCDADITGSGVGGAWSPGGVILFGARDGLYRVQASGGDPELLTQTDSSRGERAHGFPAFLPDGKRFLYFIESNDPDTEGVYAASLDRPGERNRILATDHKAIYAPPLAGHPGYVLWLRDQTLLAQPFDAGSLSLAGDPTRLAEDVRQINGNARAAFWTSDAGVLAYRSGSAEDPVVTLSWYGREGQRLGQAGEPDTYSDVRISPDGKSVAVSKPDQEGNRDIWIFDFDRPVMRRQTFDAEDSEHPAWSPDGSQIAFASDRTGVMQIFRKDIDSLGQPEQLTEGNNPKVLNDWSANGLYLIYNEWSAETGYDLWVLPLEGDRKPIPVARTRYAERGGRFSPDGETIAFQSTESGVPQIYIQAFPSSDTKHQVSDRSGNRPKWVNDGRELVYIVPNGAIVRAGVTITSEGIETDAPRELLPRSLAFVNGRPYSPFDVTSDGQSFLLREVSGGVETASRLRLWTYWQEALSK